MVFTLQLVIAVTSVLWLALAITLRGRSFDFDTSSARYSFHSVFAVYRQIYAGVFIFGGILSMLTDRGTGYRIILALSSVYALFFVLWLTVQYESYQHARYSGNDKSPYTGWKYATTLTLGVMSPVLFAVGLIGAVYVY